MPLSCHYRDSCAPPPPNTVAPEHALIRKHAHRLSLSGSAKSPAQGKATASSTSFHVVNWTEVFPSATSVVTLVDHVSHHAEVVNIKWQSWRLKEARERDATKAAARAKQ